MEEKIESSTEVIEKIDHSENKNNGSSSLAESDEKEEAILNGSTDDLDDNEELDEKILDDDFGGIPSPTFAAPPTSSNDEIEEIDLLQQKLNLFLSWCTVNSLTLSPKISLESKGTSHRYGMIAKADIKRGETLFKVPRTLLLDPHHGRLSSKLREYEAWLEQLGRSLDDSSGWVPLLITIMYEFVKPDSFWAPYLNLVPEISEFGHPLFWKQEVVNKELSGMALLYDVMEDRKNIEDEYKAYVLPFIMRNRELAESIEHYDMNLFKRTIAFVMAYSFTEDQESPSMIPMADMLNHHSNNNAHLIFERNHLKMISCRKIDKGDEIFNTFGKLGNAELLQMYGYTEDNNNYDTFTIYVQSLVNVVEKSGKVSQTCLQAMTALLHKTEIAMTYDFFIFDKNGMRRGPDLVQFLKILHMSEDEFETVLKSRIGKRPDSFCQKLLRKLKLARKTDTSSGVAVIDITEDENDTELDTSISKRSFECEEIEDNDSTNGSPPIKRHCIYEGGDTPSGADLPLSHFEESEASVSGKNNLSHFPLTNGVDCQQPIVIDDESENEDDHENETEDGKKKELENEKDGREKENNKNEETENSEDKLDTNEKNELSKDEVNTQVCQKNDFESKNEEDDDNKEMDESEKGCCAADEDEVTDETQNDGDQSVEGNEEKGYNDDDDEIEIISEDVGCAITFEKLREVLQPEWKKTIIETLQTQLSSMKNDDDFDASQASQTLSRDQYNAYNVRQGQRSLIKTFILSLS